MDNFVGQLQWPKAYLLHYIEKPEFFLPVLYARSWKGIYFDKTSKGISVFLAAREE